MLESFRTAPPPRQLMGIAGIGVSLCLLLALVYFLWFRTSYDVLYRDLRPADAATIVAELERTGSEDGLGGGRARPPRPAAAEWGAPGTGYRLGAGATPFLAPEGRADPPRVHIAGQALPL